MGSGVNSRFRAKFLAAWIASRVIDSTTTWYILGNNLGKEMNPIAMKFMEYLGLEEGLVVFTVIGIFLGFALSIAIPRLLQCEWCMTPFDRMIFSVWAASKLLR